MMAALLPDAAWWPVLLPALALAALALLPRPDWARWLNAVAAAATLLLVLALLATPYSVTGLLRADAANLPLVLLTAVLGLVCALAPGPEPARARRHHAATQGLQAGILLALLADDLGLLWAGVEAAVVAGVVLLGAERRPRAAAASWRMLLSCGGGLALALFGTVLLHLAAQPLGLGGGVSWAALRGAAARADPGLLNLAWAFLLVGYGTVAGLVPMHAWVAGTQGAASPTGAALMAGLLPMAALHALARAGAVVGAHPGALPPGLFLVGLGLVSVLLAGVALWSLPGLRRRLAWASTGQLGLAAVGFGLGGAGTLAALLQLQGHALCRAAAEFALGRAPGAAEPPQPHWVLLLGLPALAGLPPFAPFFAELLLMAEAARRPPVLALLGPGLALVAAALLRARGTLRPGPGAAPHLAWVLLGLAVVLGLALPAPLAGMLAEGARLLG